VASRGVLIVAQHPREPFRLPTFLPTPSTTPFPHIPVCSHSPPRLSPRTPLPTPFTRPVPFPSNYHSPPLLQQTRAASLPLPLALLDSLDETPSDIHRHVSSELIIKCIIVPARIAIPPHATLSFRSLVGPRKISFRPRVAVSALSSLLPPTAVARYGSSNIFGWRSRTRRA